jgi:hypothetical protein
MGGNKMSERPTPETDALISVGLENADKECVPADFARKLERERDEAIRQRDETNESSVFSCNFYYEEKLKAERERDEAREELKNEMKWHHRTHKELVEAQCKLLDIEYDKLKS